MSNRPMNAPSLRAVDRHGDAVVPFFVLACGITWALDLPLAIAWATNATPPAYAMSLVGLGALGPSLAAFVLAARSSEWHDVFGRWRTRPLWIVVALLLPLALQLPATCLEFALGGKPAHWFYPPTRPEHFAALVMFPLGEEFGWRGFAYPRLEKRYGAVVGSLVLGAIWGLWHAGMLFAPEPLRALPPETILVYMANLALWSVIIAWVFERSDRSIAVAIASHAGAHLDNVSRAPETEIRLRLLRFAVLAVAATFAAASSAGPVLLVVRDAPRRLTAVFFHFDDQASVGFGMNRIDPDPAAALERHSRHEIEGPLVQRANERGPPHETVSQGTLTMRTLGLRREDSSVSPVEDGETEGPDVERAALPFWNGRQRAETHVLAHRDHPTTGNDCRN